MRSASFRRDDLAVAVCHEWTVRRAGSEQVAGRIAATTDARDVYTFANDPDVSAQVFPGRRIHTSWIGNTGVGRRLWPLLLPLMSRWWRRLDLSGYEVVVTCSHSTVNSIRPRRDAVHISYCCTPMRYAWMWREESRRVPRGLRPLYPLVAALLRAGDRRRSKRVDVFLAVSDCVSRRIARWYGKPSNVVYPPVDTAFFTPDETLVREGFYLCAGRLVAYKRVDTAVRAARIAGVRLIVAGSGPELDRLRRLAGPETEFRPNPTSEELRDLYRRARALVFPGVEDFGMVPVEAQACGTPVIALGAGGAVESVVDGKTGLLYLDASADGLVRALAEFDGASFDVRAIRENAERFGTDRFDAEITAIIEARVHPFLHE